MESRNRARPAHRSRRTNIAPGASEGDSKVRHAVEEGRRFTAIFVIVVEHCLMANVVVLERNEFAVRARAQSHALLRARAMADGLEHHFATDHDFHRLS